MTSLLLAAFPPELGELLGEPPEGWHAECTGLGALAAAVATARLLAQLRPRRVLFAGTCGAYDARLEVGTCFAASLAVATSAPELRRAAYRPQAERTRWAATWSLPFRAHPVAVPPAITTDPADAALLADVAPAEHLELTGVFAACHAAGVDCAALLGVANRVGPGAHREWQAHHRAVSRALAEALQREGVFAMP